MASRTFARSSVHTVHFSKHVLVLFLIFLCVGLGLLSGYRYFRVVHVICSADLQSCDQRTLEAIDNLRGKSMLSIQPPVIAGKQVTIEKKYPQTLFVRVRVQQVIAAIFLDGNQTTGVLLYADSSLSDPTSASSLAGQELKITDLRLSADGKLATPLSQAQFEVYTDLLEFSKTTKVEQIVIRSDDEIEISTQMQLKALVSVTKLAWQLRSLQLLLASPTIEKKPARVDMRFDQPVLLYDY